MDQPPDSDPPAAEPANWQEAGAIVHALYPLIPEEVIEYQVRIYGQHVDFIPGRAVWMMVHAAYGWARRDPEWRIRIAVLERERQQVEAYLTGTFAEQRLEQREQRKDEGIPDVERLRLDALDSLKAIRHALDLNQPRREVKRLVEEAIAVIKEWQ